MKFAFMTLIPLFLSVPAFSADAVPASEMAAPSATMGTSAAASLAAVAAKNQSNSFSISLSPEIKAGDSSRLTSLKRHILWLSEDPRFSFASADAAFKTARVPTPTEIVGKWLHVGSVRNPAANGSAITSYYATDGRHTIAGEGGYFINTTQIDSIADAFGKTTETITESTIGAETGKIYGVEGPFALAFTATDFNFASEVTGDDSCAMQWTCRIVVDNGMLLCAGTVIDPKPVCNDLKIGVIHYHGYTRVADQAGK